MNMNKTIYLVEVTSKGETERVVEFSTRSKAMEFIDKVEKDEVTKCFLWEVER